MKNRNKFINYHQVPSPSTIIIANYHQVPSPPTIITANYHRHQLSLSIVKNKFISVFSFYKMQCTLEKSIKIIDWKNRNKFINHRQVPSSPTIITANYHHHQLSLSIGKNKFISIFLIYNFNRFLQSTLHFIKWKNRNKFIFTDG